MIDELISGLLGNTLAEIVSKLAPPRKKSEFDQLGIDTLRRRNNYLYVTAGGTFTAIFLAIFVSLIAGAWTHDGWQIGLMFGLPFSVMFLFVLCIGVLKGVGRVREFLHFCEIKTKFNIHVLIWPQVPFVLLGFVSLYKLLV
jgi:hypothetical protein